MAKLVKSDKEEMDLGFQNVPKGTYNWQIMEGVKLWKAADNPDSDGTSQSISLNIPIQVQSIARVKNNPAEESAVGMSSSFQVWIQKKDGTPSEPGEKQLCTLLTILGVMDRLMKKFPGDIDFTDQKFVDTLALALPAKMFEARHNVSKDKQGVERMRFEHVSKVKSASDGVAYKKSEVEAGSNPTTSNPTQSADEDW